MDKIIEGIFDRFNKRIDSNLIDQNNFEYYVILGILKNDNPNKPVLYDFVKNHSPIDLSYYEFGDKLYKLYLGNLEYRELRKNEIIQLTSLLMDFYLSPNREKYDNLKLGLQTSKGLVPKGLAINFFTSDLIFIENKEKIENLLKITKKNDSKFLLYDFIDELAISQNIIKRLSPIEKQNEDLRNSLEISIQEIEELKSVIEEIKIEAKHEATLSFLRDFNSKGGNNLLDQFSISANTIKGLKKEKFQFPDEIQSIPVVVRMFMQFLEDIGVKPIKEIGRVFEVNLKESEEYDYVGTPFLDECTKKIVIETPGWKYGEQIITKPKIKEIL